MPLHVLTGFLGSGKTTLLNRLLRDPDYARTAVIVNEFGDIGVDHHLVESSDDDLVTLSGGCVCCTVRGDLAATLAMLLGRREQGSCVPFERIVVETTGLADPQPILNLLLTDALLAERLRAASVTTVVDAVNGLQTLDTHAEAERQLLLCSNVVISKSDLPDGARALGALEQRIQGLNPRAARQTGDALPAAALLAHDADMVRLDAQEISAAAPHRHSSRICSFTLERGALPAAVLPLLVTALAQQLGASLLRLKGLVALRELGDRPVVLHGAQHVFHPLTTLPAWPAGMAPGTRLVFIVDHTDAKAAAEFCSRLLDALCAEVDALQQRVQEDAGV